MQESIKRLESEIKDTKEAHQSFQLAVIESLGDIKTSVNGLNITMINEIQTMKDFRSKTESEIVNLKTEMIVLKRDFITIDKRQSNLITTQEEYKGIRNWFGKSLGVIILAEFTIVGVLFAMMKDMQ